MSGILCLKWNNHTSTFIQNLDNLRSKELYCDATLTCCGKYYPAHRFVLTTCSEYFEEIFARAPCKHPFIILKDIDHIQLEALLNYMYKGEVNVLQENLPGLIRAAEALKVKGLAVSEDGNDSKQLKEREAHSSSPNNDKVVSSETKRLHSCVSTDEMETNGNKEINEVEHLNGKSSILPSSVDEDKCMNSSTNDENEKESPDSNKDNDQFNLEEDSIEDDIKREPGDSEDTLDTEEKFQVDCSNSEKDTQMFVSMLNPNIYSENQTQGHTDMINGFAVPQCSSWTDNLANADTLSKEILQSSWLQSSDYDSFPMDPLHYLSVDDAESTNYSSSTLEESSINIKEETQRRGKSSGKNSRKYRKYQCNECSFSTNDKAAFRLHTMRKHTGEKPFACSLCSYRCTTKDMLKIHTRKHTGERPFSCPYCSCRMAVKSSLKRHILLKHMQSRKTKSRSSTDSDATFGTLKTYKCNYCSYESQMKSNLKLHCMRIHTGEKPIACGLCPYRTTTKPQLEKHMRKHTGEKPFACTFCSYKAAQKHSLLRHMSLHTK